MVYKEFQDLKLSALGMGAMRLPLVDGKDENIDEAATAKMVAYGFEKGINYFDTAWGYHGGNSELVMGRVLNIQERSFIWRRSSRGMTLQICLRWRRFSRSSWRNARFRILTSICSTMSVR